MKVVFIAYFFKPYQGVGAQRVTYWVENVSQYGIQPEVITTIEQKEQSAYPIHVVKNTGEKRIFSAFIKDQGYTWYTNLKKFIEKNKFEGVDAFVITGGPFMHFKIAGNLKKLYPSAKIVFDYRDPFSVNPRFNEGKLRSSIKKFFEQKFNRFADQIITVNTYCSTFIQTNKKVEIIDNGFDEAAFLNIDFNILEQKNSNKVFVLAYAGSLYPNSNPTTFLNVISKKFQSTVTFDHFGNKSELLTPFLNENNINYKGKLPYKELIKKLTTYDCLTLFTSGDPFESTTKIFDYMALNKRILLVTEGELYTGALHEITKDYPNIIWAKNNQNDLHDKIIEIQKLAVKPFDASIFSRKESLKKFVELLKK